MRVYAGFVILIVLWNKACGSYVTYEKEVTASSLFTGGTNGVTDGDDYSVFSSSCSHTRDNQLEFFKIDLEKEYSITKVTIINRVQPASSSHLRLEGAEVRIGNTYDSMQTESKCGETISREQVELSAIVDLTCDEPISGRYLMLWHPTRSDFLNICEIRAYNEFEPEISECSTTERYADYNGLLSVTENGRICQSWKSTSPHSHGYTSTGAHNLCRNPDNEPRPWCYTVDPNVRWEYCNAANIGASCPLDPIVDDLDVAVTKELDLNCLSYWIASVKTSYISNSIDSACEFDDNSQRIHQTINFETDRFGTGVTTFTIAIYVYPSITSSGDILTTNGIRVAQTYSNGYLYHSEITVYNDDVQLIRAHVLLPDVWTFIALTVDCGKKEIRLWRDGEIASLAYTNFESIDIVSNEILLGSTDGNFMGKVAMLQMYDRALNEAEMKAARDRIFEYWLLTAYGNFMKLPASQGVEGSQLLESTEPSALSCSKICLQHTCCDAFRFKKTTNLCSILKKSTTTESGESDVECYRKNSQYYPVINYC